MIDTSALSRQFEASASTIKSLLNSIPLPTHITRALDKNVQDARSAIDVQKGIVSTTPSDEADAARYSVSDTLLDLYNEFAVVTDMPEAEDLWAARGADVHAALGTLMDLEQASRRTALDIAAATYIETLAKSRAVTR